MGIQMIAVDMDGTFLDSHSQYDRDRFDKIYQELKRRGIRFVVASGNPYKQLCGSFDDHIKDELIYISENGGYIVENKQDIYLSHLETKDVHRIIEILKSMPDVLSWMCTKNQSYTLETISDDYYEMFLPYFPGVQKMTDYSLVLEPVIKFALYLPENNVEERINDFLHVVSENVHVVDSGHKCVDLIPNHVNKGEAIALLMQRFGLCQSEVMAFGDAGNDLEMLKRVGYGYMMENAKTELKKQFQYIAPSHDEMGVLEVIEHYLNTGTFINLK